MTDWYISTGATSTAAFDSLSSSFVVYQRQNFRRVSDIINNQTVDLLIYDERQLSHDEFQKLRISQLESENTQLQLALTELYEALITRISE